MLEDMKSHGGPMEEAFMGVMRMSHASFNDSGVIDPRELIDFVVTELKRKNFSQGTVTLYLKWEDMPGSATRVMWVGEDDSIDWLGACSLPSSWDVKMPEDFASQGVYENLTVLDSKLEDLLSVARKSQLPKPKIVGCEQSLKLKTLRETDLESEMLDLLV